MRRRLARFTTDRPSPAYILERPPFLDDDVKLLALTIDERAIILGALEDPPDGLAELRAVLLGEHEWRQRSGLDS